MPSEAETRSEESPARRTERDTARYEDTAKPERATEGDSAIKKGRSETPIQRSSTIGSSVAGGSSPGDTDGKYVSYDPGPDRGAIQRKYGMDVSTGGQAERLHRLEAQHGSEHVQRWADEGMTVATMGKPQDMQAFRERQASRSAEIPSDVERRNEASVHRNSTGDAEGGFAGETRTPDVVRDVVSSPGQSMDPTVQREMEAKIGGDFSDVQIHSGPKAAAAAESIDARAFTVGNHVAFNRGEYSPESDAGKEVMAHELTHVRQQTDGRVSMLPKADADHVRRSSTDARGGGTIDRHATGMHVQPKLEVSSPDDPAEKEAERVAERVTNMDEGDAASRSCGCESATCDCVESAGPQRILQRRTDSVQLVDARSQQEYRDGHLPGAVNIPASSVSRRASDASTRSDVAVYCRSGERSKHVARALASRKQASGTVLNVSGGIDAMSGEVSGSDGLLSKSTDGVAGDSCGCRTTSQQSSDQTLRREIGGKPVQAKLEVSHPNDPAEKEAERVAEQVMKMDDPSASAEATDGSNSVQGSQTSRASDSDLAISASAVTAATAGAFPVGTSQASGMGGETQGGAEEKIDSVRNSSGKPLPEATRSYFEPRFGSDFSDVEVHTGSNADEAARSIQAEAFTVGSDVAFRSGAYQPASDSGKELIAHELTHVVQQTDGRSLADRKQGETPTVRRSDEIVHRWGMPDVGAFDPRGWSMPDLSDLNPLNYARRLLREKSNQLKEEHFTASPAGAPGLPLHLALIRNPDKVNAVKKGARDMVTGIILDMLPSFLSERLQGDNQDEGGNGQSNGESEGGASNGENADGDADSIVGRLMDTTILQFDVADVDVGSDDYAYLKLWALNASAAVFTDYEGPYIGPSFANSMSSYLELMSTAIEMSYGSGWSDSFDNCPVEVPADRSSKNGFEDRTSGATENNHPGATRDYRKHQSGTPHSQQCIYGVPNCLAEQGEERHILITKGNLDQFAGTKDYTPGTPDVYSPYRDGGLSIPGVLAHQLVDVWPAQDNYSAYVNAAWEPNSGVSVDPCADVTQGGGSRESGGSTGGGGASQQEGGSSGSSGVSVYTVQDDDFGLSQIAMKLGVADSGMEGARMIAEWNDELADVNSVFHPGDELVIKEHGTSVDSVDGLERAQGGGSGETAGGKAGSGGKQGGKSGAGGKQGGGKAGAGGKQQDEKGGSRGGGSGGGKKPRWIDIAEKEKSAGIQEWGPDNYDAKQRGQPLSQEEMENSNPEIKKYFDQAGYLPEGIEARGDHVPWCAVFVNYCIEKAGYDGASPSNGGGYCGAAANWEQWGQQVSAPTFGSVAVVKGGSHVGFVVGKSGGSIQLLGGNQSDEVNVSTYSASGVTYYGLPGGVDPTTLPSLGEREAKAGGNTR